jgi:chemotaxis protein MotD
MSESVQLASLQPPRSAHANRSAHDDKASSGGFDKALNDVDERHVPSRDAKAAGKQARRDERDDKAEGGIGGAAAFYARLFSLDDTPASAAKEALAFKIHAPDDKAADDQNAEGDETAVPALAAAASTALPAMRGAAAEPAENGNKPSGKARSPLGDAAPATLKGEVPGANAKETAASKVADAAADAARDQAGNTGPEAGKDGPGDHLAQVKVVSAQSAPAPVAAQLPSPTATALARAIHTGITPGASAAHAAAAAQQPQAPAAVHTLNIQLQPETLGTVNARLHLSGDSLRVDLQVDNADAHHRLKTDSDAIVKSLRALGYDVDRVTIQAPAPSQPSTSGQNAASQGREQSFQQAQGNSGNGQGSSHAGSGRENGQGAAHQAMERQEQRSPSGGLYI